MKTPSEIQENLKQFESKFSLPVVGAEQQSEAWFNLKLGVISASNASKLVAKKGTSTRDGYISELVAQVATGLMPEIKGAALQWGNDHEDPARASYEFSSGKTVTELPFVFKDDSFRFGCSPDGFVTDNRGVEIKCPFSSKNYIDFLIAKKIKPEWQWQVQFSMWVTGAEEWDFCEFDPRMKKSMLKIHTIKRDIEKIEKIEACAKEFVADMDAVLAAAGFEFGEQWTRLKKEQ